MHPTSMAAPNNKAESLFSKSLCAVLCSQFLSAFADNSILIVAIAILKTLEMDKTYSPLLQAVFVIPFILLAALVGPFADAHAKGRVLLAGNGVKMLGALGLLSLSYLFVPSQAFWFSVFILISYAMVGVGAAAYSPAKYGILTQLVSPQRLVQANGLMEGSTIVAILLGVLVGGMLADYSISVALWAVALCYLLSMLCCLLIPVLPKEHPLDEWRIKMLFLHFFQASKTLLKDADTRFSLLGTGLFWGAAATLRLILFAWVPFVLGDVRNQTPSNLMGAVSIGVVIGAALATQWVRLENARRAITAGLLIGLVIIAFSCSGYFGFKLGGFEITVLYFAYAFSILNGVCGGFFIVPLNALLQHTAHSKPNIGAGTAIAVQNFVENIAMLLLASFYFACVQADWSIVMTGCVFGLIVFCGMASLAYFSRKKAS